MKNNTQQIIYEFYQKKYRAMNMAMWGLVVMSIIFISIVSMTTSYVKKLTEETNYKVAITNLRLANTR